MDQLDALLQSDDPGIRAENFACGGANTVSVIYGDNPNSGAAPRSCRGPGTQLQQAEAFLRTHRGHVPLVTIDIGGGDFKDCLRGPGSGYSGRWTVNPGCMQKLIPTVRKNIHIIEDGLQTATGPQALQGPGLPRSR